MCVTSQSEVCISTFPGCSLIFLLSLCETSTNPPGAGLWIVRDDFQLLFCPLSSARNHSGSSGRQGHSLPQTTAPPWAGRPWDCSNKTLVFLSKIKKGPCGPVEAKAQESGAGCLKELKQWPSLYFPLKIRSSGTDLEALPGVTRSHTHLCFSYSPQGMMGLWVGG